MFTIRYLSPVNSVGYRSMIRVSPASLSLRDSIGSLGSDVTVTSPWAHSTIEIRSARLMVTLNKFYEG